MTQHQRFTFRFVCTEEHRTEEVVLVGTNGEDARSGAWAILGDRVHDRFPREFWRVISMRQEPVGLHRIAQRIVASVVLVLLLPLVAFAAEPRVMGTITVGEFRTWPESGQLGYIVGWREHSALLSVACTRQVTNAEYIAALKWTARLSQTDLLSKALFALEFRDGCRAER